MLIVKIIGFLFVACMAVCWIRPSLWHLFHEKPSAIVRSAYSFITIYGLLLGLHMIYFKELEGSVQQYLENIFQDGVLSGRTSLVLAAVFVSLCFVLANLTRSYYNLYKIEDEQDGSAIRFLISGFGRGARIFEGLLRFSMFVSIVLITRKIASMNKEIPNSGSLLGVEVFRDLFDGFWHLTRNYYLLLIVWDAVIWIGNKRAPSVDSGSISKVVWVQAVPVHVAGLVVALMMCLPRHIKELSPYVDLCSQIALIFAIIGSIFLALSTKSEAPEVLRPLLFWKRPPASSKGRHSAESEA
ncbi:MAG TPA: hypothetical protein VGP62_16165 [Bryobacteraceae bacterium]|jgi:hypothetical protein|nr:hypothetical protein [Bryobacteraceae bacterium]